MSKPSLLSKNSSLSPTLEAYHYMQEALKEAQKAAFYDEVPIGAIVINSQGIIVGRGFNAVEQSHRQTAHAEVIAINQACQALQDWRLDGHILYVTLEPCSMCINLVLLSRIKRVVFGASSPIFGYQLDNRGPLQVYRRDTLEVIGGVCEEESSAVLKKFFKEKRNCVWK